MKGGSLYISLSKLVYSLLCYICIKHKAKHWPLSELIIAFDLLNGGFIFSLKPISRIFMPLCLLALWQF